MRTHNYLRRTAAPPGPAAEVGPGRSLRRPGLRLPVAAWRVGPTLRIPIMAKAGTARLTWALPEERRTVRWLALAA